MRILITTLTMMFISFGAVAKDTIYKCAKDTYFKVENPLIGKRKLFNRRNGEWVKVCNHEGSKITKDSFRCASRNKKGNFVLLDEFLKELIFINLNEENTKFSCVILNNSPKTKD